MQTRLGGTVGVLFLCTWSALGVLGAHAAEGYLRGAPFDDSAQRSNQFLGQVQPVLERRCTVCHSCFEAPCQLKMESADYLERGANNHRIMGGFVAAMRTDLFLTREEQRSHGFVSVTDGGLDSILGTLVLEGTKPAPGLPQRYIRPTAQACVTTPRQLQMMQPEVRRSLGMPYYAAPLEPSELGAILGWLEQGAPMPSPQLMKSLAVPKNAGAIAQWEAFFNDPSWKGRWTARFLYEHLFTAHFYFDESPGEFYELVRSSTAAPQDIREIPSPRPFEIPAQYANSFSYRLRKITGTIVYKQHFVYRLSADSLRALEELFWKPRWNDSPATHPFGYQEKNPFESFRSIPAASRYRWMLENARMLIDMDMRSENCHGLRATEPLRENFLFVFMRPESDVSVVYPDFFDSAIPDLRMTNVNGSNLLLAANYKAEQEAYSRTKRRYQDQLLPNGLSYDDIWDGDGGRHMPLFTIMRHQENASVHDGPWGPRPRVTLLFDFVSFERLYYNCVALTTLHDNTIDKIGTVLYLRDVGREAEEQLLSLLPEVYRPRVRSTLVRGKGREHLYDVSRFALRFNPALLKLPGLRIDPQDPYASMMDYLLEKSGRFSLKTLGTHYYPTAKTGELTAQMRATAEQIPGRATYFPNIAYVVVKDEKGRAHDYTWIVNRYYDYVNYLTLNTSDGRVPARDTLTIFPGIQANYPQKIYMVDSPARVPAFLAAVKAVRDRVSYQKFDAEWGLQKMSPRFWSEIDRLQNAFIQKDNIQNGLIDLHEYGVHDLRGSP